MIKHILLTLGVLLLLTGCSISSFGKFQAQDGMPSFIKVGETTKEEIFQELGEPLIYRTVADKDTAIYNSERGVFYFIYGTYEGSELVVRFKEDVVSYAKIEKTGSGWGILAPATHNNPGTRRSARWYKHLLSGTYYHYF